jgi:hypothetical protein
MQDLVHSLLNTNSPFGMIVLVVLIGSAFGLVGTIAAQIRKFATHRADVQLKRELVERGLSVEEIERVVAAKSPRERSREERS